MCYFFDRQYPYIYFNHDLCFPNHNSQRVYQNFDPIGYGTPSCRWNGKLVAAAQICNRRTDDLSHPEQYQISKHFFLQCSSLMMVLK